MAPVTNARLIFNEIPSVAVYSPPSESSGLPEPGKTTIYDTSETIDLENVPLHGGALIKTLVLSVDPYLRGRMRDPSIESYVPAFTKGKPLDNFGVGVVLRSEDPAIKPGDHLYGYFPFQQYLLSQDLSIPSMTTKLPDDKLPWSVYLGVCGMPGQTAYYGWKEHAKPNPGDVVFVSTGAGVVGSVVIQLAKAEGLKVIASAGSDEKVAFMKELGADVAFNYKTEKTSDVLAREGPINIYWDNVGGETLEAAIAAAADNAQFIECGYITSYNGEDYHIKNLQLIFAKQLTLSGFLINRLRHKYQDAFYSEMPARVARGEIKYTEDITRGLEKAGEAIVDVQTGKNKGKSVILVAEE
ncbi:predicted protein [Postia placenta Mad-698-R]|nr:predicted protein [Postia placenta Mad-698-R]